MAHIYGQSGSEKALIRKCPKGIKNLRDIETSLKKSKNKLEQERKTFFDNLPKVIHTAKDTLENLRIREEFLLISLLTFIHIFPSAFLVSDNIVP